MAIDTKADRAPGSRGLFLLALLTLTVVAAVAFGRVFKGDGPALRLGLAAAVAVVLAAALERRNVLLATLVSAVGLAVAIGLLVFPTTTRFGLPTLRTWHALTHAWSAIGEAARTEVAPARPLKPLFLAGLVAVWSASFSSHALAVRARSPFLALLPPAALLAFTGILLEEGARPLYVIVFLAAAIAVLFADGLRRVGQWGPVTAWQGRRRLRWGTTATTRGARRLAMVCLGVAVIVPGILPGFHKAGLVELRTGGTGNQVAIDPIVDIARQLTRSTPIDLMTITSTEPAYWRFISLDKFDGRRWYSSDLEAAKGTTVTDGPVQSRPPLQVDDKFVHLVQQHVEFLGLRQTWLPAAYDPISVDGHATLRYDPTSATLVDPGFAARGFNYDVVSRVVIPTPDALDAVTDMDTPFAAPFLQLPDLPPIITDMAHQWTDDEATPYRKVLAVQNHLRRDYRYDLNIQPGHDINHIVNFLTVIKRGFCEQFAGTMAVMLRALGIPARVAVGFTAGDRDRQDQTQWHISTENAHAWVEVLFPGYGWLPFEPTPNRVNPEGLRIANPPLSFFGDTTPPGSANTPTETCRRTRGGLEAGDPCSGVNQPNPTPSRRADNPGPQSTEVPHHSWFRLNGWGGVALVLLLLLASIPTWKLVRRRLVLARARVPRERVLAAYGLLTDAAADVGLGREPSETLWEYRTRLKVAVPTLDGQLDAVTRLAGWAAYSGQAVSGDQAVEAATAARGATRAIRRSVGAGRKLAGWFRIDRTSVMRWASG
jgi:transglutaminase-like putative cysteine protease